MSVSYLTMALLDTMVSAEVLHDCVGRLRLPHTITWMTVYIGRLLQILNTACACMQELAGLRGVPFCVSLALEVVDFAAPLLQRLIGRAGDALSWLLVRLIGRSLGLVYRGVRESLVRPGGGAGGGRAKRRAPPRPSYAGPSG